MTPAPTGNNATSQKPKSSRLEEATATAHKVHFTGESSSIPITTRQYSNTTVQADGANEAKPHTNIAPPPQQHKFQESQGGSTELPKESSQPQAFSGIGHFPGATQPDLQWHRSAVPGQSLASAFPTPGSHLTASHNTFVGPASIPHHQYNGQFSLFGSQSIPKTPTTFLGHQGPRSSNMAGDYQNTAPPPRGHCYQPPVPDTTFGPMYHVYTPRFDPPGVVPPAPVGHQPVQYIPVPTFLVNPATQAVFTPNYAYYASAPTLLCICSSAMWSSKW